MSQRTIEIVEKRTFLEFFEIRDDAEDEVGQRNRMSRAKTEPHSKVLLRNKAVTFRQVLAEAHAADASSLPRLLQSSQFVAPTYKVIDAAGKPPESVSTSAVSSTSDLTDKQSAQSKRWADKKRAQHNADNRTTLMFRNLPNDYNREMFLHLMDSESLVGAYDFVYFPMDFKTGSGLGYAFVNFVNHSEALRAWERLIGYKSWFVPSTKTCDIRWSYPVQGLAANVERYRNSPVMHPHIPDLYKPMVLSNGTRVPFPAPRKSIKCMPLQKASVR